MLLVDVAAVLLDSSIDAPCCFRVAESNEGESVCSSNFAAVLLRFDSR